MASSYTTQQAVTLATRAAFYEQLALVLRHLDPLNINLSTITRNGDNTVTFVVDKAISPEQLAHLGLS